MISKKFLLIPVFGLLINFKQTLANPDQVKIRSTELFSAIWNATTHLNSNGKLQIGTDNALKNFSLFVADAVDSANMALAYKNPSEKKEVILDSHYYRQAFDPNGHYICEKDRNLFFEQLNNAIIKSLELTIESAKSWLAESEEMVDLATRLSFRKIRFELMGAKRKISDSKLDAAIGFIKSSLQTLRSIRLIQKSSDRELFERLNQLIERIIQESSIESLKSGVEYSLAPEDSKYLQDSKYLEELIKCIEEGLQIETKDLSLDKKNQLLDAIHVVWGTHLKILGS